MGTLNFIGDNMTNKRCYLIKIDTSSHLFIHSFALSICSGGVCMLAFLCATHTYTLTMYPYMWWVSEWVSVYSRSYKRCRIRNYSVHIIRVTIAREHRTNTYTHTHTYTTEIQFSDHDPAIRFKPTKSHWCLFICIHFYFLHCVLCFMY